MVPLDETFDGTFPFAPHTPSTVMTLSSTSWTRSRIRDYVAASAAGVSELCAKPAILFEGLADGAIPPDHAIADFRALWPDAPVLEMSGVRHFCQEDAPCLLVAEIRQLIQANP